MDGPRRAENTERVLRYAADHPRWQVSRQMHKVLGIR
jgi:hypothetical protein